MTYCWLIIQILRIIWVRCIPLSLRSKTRRRATPLLPTWINSCRSGGTVSCSLPFTTNVAILNFHFTNIPILSSNISSSTAYGVLISQLIQYARACSSYECFILMAERLSYKLLGLGYARERLKSSFMKFYCRYGISSNIMKVFLSQMLHDILGHDHIQWHPQLIRYYSNLRERKRSYSVLWQ